MEQSASDASAPVRASGLLSTAGEGVDTLAAAYLAELVQPFDAPAPVISPAAAPPGSCSADDIVDLLCHRRFTHLSQTQARRYRAAMRAPLQTDLDAGRPLRFFYDLGGGYRAGVQPDFSDLQFAPGLGELLALRQIRHFAQAVERVYRPGVHFSLVIDDLCAWVTNDIPLHSTAAYCAGLAALIERVNLGSRVAVLAESALGASAAYRAAFEQHPSPIAPLLPEPAHSVVENVSRFVGRACSPGEVLDRLERYQRALAVSERWLTPWTPGVRLTQRATDTCLGFRSFPGGDSRLQAGAMVLTWRECGAVRPMLLTSKSLSTHWLHPLPVAAVPPNWPLAAEDACVAWRLPAPTSAGGSKRHHHALSNPPTSVQIKHP